MRYEFARAVAHYMLKPTEGALEQYPFNTFIPQVAESYCLPVDQLNRATLRIAKLTHNSYNVPRINAKEDEGIDFSQLPVYPNLSLDEAISKAATELDLIDPDKVKAIKTLAYGLEMHPLSRLYLATQVDNAYDQFGKIRHSKRRGPQKEEPYPRLKMLHTYPWWLHSGAYEHFRPADAPRLPLTTNTFSPADVSKFIQTGLDYMIDDRQWIVPVRILE